jgi:hypothetical protein
MKKILFIATIAFGFFACNPMQDINDEIDKSQDAENEKAVFLKDRMVAPAAYTLTEDDYKLSSNESVSKYKSFSKYALPKDYLPEILNQKFSGEDAQSMMVTYDFYSKPKKDYIHAYEISDEEYGEMGQSHKNFSDEDVAEALIGKLLDRKVYSDEPGAEMTAKYVLFSKYETRYIKVNADGTSEEVAYDKNAVEVTDEIYEETGNGKYKTFYTIDAALEDLAKYAIDNGTAPITYAGTVYKNYIDTYVVYLFSGTNWVVKQSVMPVSEELNYSLNEDDITKSYWWADPAIKITLTADDYALYPETSKYGNFDLRSGKTPGTDHDKLIEMISGMLDANYTIVEGQEYLVTYNYYDGSSGAANIRLIKNGGNWSEVTGS